MYDWPVGSPLYTDTTGAGVYREDGLPFVAFPVEWYESGFIRPGEWIWLEFPNQEEWLYAQALDAGPFGPSTGLCVEQWGCDKPIVADVPKPFAPFPGLSAPVRLWRVEVEGILQ